MNCPYCSSYVSDKPTLDIVCKYCRKRIYVRIEPETGIKRLFTREQAEKFDEEREKEFNGKAK